MIRRTKRLIVFITLIVVAYIAYLAISLIFLPPVSVLKDRKKSISITVRDWQGNKRPFLVGPKNPWWTPSSQMPDEMKWAVILAEDPNFYHHEGVDVVAIKRAIRYDLEKRRLARGASTITQQVAKNVFLSREKTLSRKLKEIYLAWRMEDELSKGRIVELYLNVVELGPMVYGIGHGSHYYFGKSPSELTPRECSFLAAMLPGPRMAFNPYKHLGKVLKRSDDILSWMRQRGVLTEEEYLQALAEVPNINRLQQKVDTTIVQQEKVFANMSGATVSGEATESDGAKDSPLLPKGGEALPPPPASGENAPVAEPVK
jgi:monofunctional biosynthetic peptidoglycan transglycosylase